MNKKVVLFDLDGTLLPMDQDEFVNAYFGALAKKLAPRGYEPQKLIKAIWSGTKAMIMNSGAKTNEEIFWDDFSTIYGEDARNDLPFFDEFYRTDFKLAKSVCGFNPKVPELIAKLKEAGYRLVLATNPIFPAVATKQRIEWAGLSEDDFEFYTTYENSNHSKPNPEYYNDILKQLNVNPEDCLMVGNDVGDDMVAKKLGIDVFLLTDCLINKTEEDIESYPNGDFSDLMNYIFC